MEVEAALPSPQVRFDRIVKNYALRIIFLPEGNPIQTRIPASFLLKIANQDLEDSNWDQHYLDWSQTHLQKKSPTQLIRILASLNITISTASALEEFSL